MSGQEIENQSRGWIKAAWSALILGWLSYFALMAFATRSPWMHTYAAYIALGFLVSIVTFSLLAWRNRQGGLAFLLVALIATPVIWYFVSVAAMAVIAYQAG